MTRIMIMAGEASGDQHGARLAAALREQEPAIELVGLGGKRMQAAGVRVLEGIERLDIIGLPTLAEARAAWRTYQSLKRRLQELELDAVVLIDNPGLNLRLAKAAKRAGHRVIYFVAPQIWAWNRGRIKVIRRVVDLVLVILPFEEVLYREAGVPVRFVGHPLVDDIPADLDRAAIRRRLGIDAGGQALGLLPGSRLREVRALLPMMLAAAGRLSAARSGEAVPLAVLLAPSSSIPTALVDEIVAQAPVKPLVVRDGAIDVMAAADMLLVASGTATLQAAVVGTPMAIAYRLSRIEYIGMKLAIRVPWIGLANLVSGRQIAPELIQGECTPERLAEEAARVLSDREAAGRAREVARELRLKLGSRGSAGRAAEAILAQCRRS